MMGLPGGRNIRGLADTGPYGIRVETGLGICFGLICPNGCLRVHWLTLVELILDLVLELSVHSLSCPVSLVLLD